jgi:hypothetical protein
MHLQRVWASLLWITLHSAGAVAAQAAPHIEFVREYIRELGEFERLRTQAEDSMRAPDANLMAEMNAYSAQQQLALRANIAVLQKIQLGEPHDALLRSIINSHNTRLRVHARINQICTAMLIGTQSGIDLTAMAAEVPNLRAMLDEIDELFLDTSSLAFTTLLDPAPDSQGQNSRLRITAAERADLLGRLRLEFGNTLDEQSPNALTHAAGVLRHYLRKDFTPADG